MTLDFSLSTPKVSVILPTYNGADRIEKAIKSVLYQTYINFEILVIDDGSEDNTKDIVCELSKYDARIRYIKNDKNIGIQKILNKGLGEAKGVYIARIDDDDIWIDKEKLQKQVSFLDNNRDYVLVGTGVIIVDEKGKELLRYKLPEKDFDIRNNILGKNCFVHSSVVFNKDAVLKIGGYSELEEVKHVEDYDLWLRLGCSGKLHNLPEHTIIFNLRQLSLSFVNKSEQFLKDVFLIKKYKDKYPKYFSAIIRAHLRIFIYGFLMKTPLRVFVKKIIKLYKENF